MTRPMKIGGYLIVQLEDQLTPEAAIGELLENCDDAGATAINIILTHRLFSISDNGEGNDDPNVIATPSLSHSRHKKKAIGSKAIGAKQALATFGRDWEIQTVPRGENRYHHYKVAWDEDGPLPTQYERRLAKPARDAPHEIRNGGTKLTVTGRRDGFPKLRLDAMCRSLERTYRPSLHSGKLKITIKNPETGFVHQLENPAYDQKLFSGPVRELASSVDGRAFGIRYGVLKEYHRALSYCHFIFGPRVIKTVDAIGKLSLPAGCYIDIILSERWKTLLSTNKNNVRFIDELIDEIERLLGDWISEQRSAASKYEMKLLCGDVSSLVSQNIAYLFGDGAGRHRPQPQEKNDQGADDDDSHDDHGERRPRKKRRRRATPGGDQGAQVEPARHCARLSIEPDEKLGSLLFRASFSQKGDEIIVHLNCGPNQREIAEYFKQKKVNDLYKIAVIVFGLLVTENKSSFKNVFSNLRARGVDIDETDRDGDIIGAISNLLLDALWDSTRSIKKVA